MLDQISNDLVVEDFETMSIACASFEQGNSKHNLSIEVRIWWSISEGMCAEPLSYEAPGIAKRTICGEPQQMDPFIRRCVADNYTEDVLNELLAERDAFADARNIEFQEQEADRAKMRRQLI